MSSNKAVVSKTEETKTEGTTEPRDVLQCLQSIAKSLETLATSATAATK